jgi:hypothetical protein
MGRNIVDDVDTIFSIVVSGAGKVSPWRRNVRPCKCAECKKELGIGQGSKFSKARFSESEYGYSGYLCGECVAGFLGKIERWYWNRFFYVLHPATDHTPTLDGRDLAVVWAEHGLSGLAFTLGQKQAGVAASAAA